MRNGVRPRGPGILAAVLSAVLLVAACSDPDQSAPPEPEVVVHTPEMATDKDNAPGPELPDLWPLTGVEGDVSDRAAVSVKVENSVAARPQTGMQDADIVWEQMIEGGETRLIGVFHSEIPDVLGPVRSLRPMDANIASAHGGVLAFSGGQTPFVSAARETDLQLMTYDGGDPGFSRSPERPAPHNLYADPSVFFEAGEGMDPPPEFFAYARTPEEATAVVDGQPAGGLSLQYPNTSPSWDWHSGSEVWRRAEAGEPAVTTDEERLTAANVIVLRVQVQNTSYRDPSGSPVPETVVVGSGEAVVATGGQAITGTWSKDSASDPVVLTTDDGEEIRLAPGNTWVELLPESGSSLTID